MFEQPVPSEVTRRSEEVQHVPGPLGSRALRFGLRATLLAPLGAAAAVTVFADENAKAGSFVPLVVAITILGVAVSFLPWDEMAGSVFGKRVLHVWAGLDLLLITLLRTWFERPESEPPAWYAAQGDPVVGPALRLMQHHPEHPWSVAELAGRAGVSRAT